MLPGNGMYVFLESNKEHYFFLTCFSTNERQDAAVECPGRDGMVYSPLEVTQGVPPFGGVDGLDSFVAAGCDGTSRTCVVRTRCSLTNAGRGVWHLKESSCA